MLRDSGESTAADTVALTGNPDVKIELNEKGKLTRLAVEKDKPDTDGTFHKEEFDRKTLNAINFAASLRRDAIIDMVVHRDRLRREGRQAHRAAAPLRELDKEKALGPDEYRELRRLGDFARDAKLTLDALDACAAELGRLLPPGFTPRQATLVRAVEATAMLNDHFLGPEMAERAQELNKRLVSLRDEMATAAQSGTWEACVELANKPISW